LDLTEARTSATELQRAEDLMSLLPQSGQTALDIGARDGYFSLRLADRFERVIALDLSKPRIEHPRIECVQGNAVALEFADASIDLVLCSEVLEHIPSDLLAKVCSEIERVSKDTILIGVPYRQDIRVGRTTCQSCGARNPPWGHVNSFDQQRLLELFPASKVERISFVGTMFEQTNAFSAALMDLAGNPYGTYVQDEPCIQCGAPLGTPPARSPAQKVLTKLAFWTRSASAVFSKPHARWIHLLLSKRVKD